MDPNRTRPPDTRNIQYYLRTDGGHSIENPSAVYRIWTDPQGYQRSESLQRVGRKDVSAAAPPFGTLRWRHTSRFVTNRRNGEEDLDPFSPMDAASAQEVITRWAAATFFPEQSGQRG